MAYIRNLSNSCFTSTFDGKMSRADFVFFDISLNVLFELFSFSFIHCHLLYSHHNLPKDLMLPQINPGCKSKNLRKSFSLGEVF